MKDVMAKGNDKKTAIRYCYKTVVQKELDEDAMKKSQREAQRKAKRQAAQLRALAKKEAVQEEIEVEDEEDMDVLDELDEEENPEEEAKELEITEKDYSSMETMPMMQPVGMPTSFEELDQQKLEAERSDALHEETWNVKTLVNNILADPDMDVSEKSSAIQAVGTDFAARAQDILGASDETAIDESKELDILELEALIARDGRQISLVDRVKAKLSYAESKALPDSAYALVRIETGKSGKKIKVRKYKIHDAAHVRNALSRAAQQIKGGNSQDAADARAALPKIHAAAKKFGIGSAKKELRSAIMVEKDASGKWRWVGIASNNFIDLDEDIISEAAHKEYIEWWEKNKQFSPVFLSWHEPLTARKTPVDFMTFENGFLIMSGPLENREAAELLRVQKSRDLGMSHGALFFSRDPKDPRVVTKYRMYEVSELPLERAANPFTSFETITKEVGMDKKKFQYFVDLYGSEDKAKEFLEKLGLAQKDLQAAGIASKEKTEETTEQTPTETTVVASAPAAEPAPVAKQVDPLIVAQVMKDLDIDGLNAFATKMLATAKLVEDLQQEVKELKGKQDEKLAEMLTPPASRVALAWSNKEARASASPETIVKDDDELAKSVPGLGDNWLSEVTGTTPIKVPDKV